MVVATAAVLALTGCGVTQSGGVSPGPTVTVTASPPAIPTDSTGPSEGTAPKVGDQLTPLNAWDVCFAHTTTQVDSDITEWSRFSPDLVVQHGPGSFTVTIENVRSGMETDIGTVTCTVEGRVGGVYLRDWTRTIN